MVDAKDWTKRPRAGGWTIYGYHLGTTRMEMEVVLIEVKTAIGPSHNGLVSTW